MGIVIGIIIVLGLAAFFAFKTIKSKNSDLFKWVGISAFIAFCLTWVLPYGSFQQGVFYESSMQRLGLADVSSILYYCVYFCLTNVLFLLAVAGFYGVLSKTDSYNSLVRKIGKILDTTKVKYNYSDTRFFMKLYSYMMLCDTETFLDENYNFHRLMNLCDDNAYFDVCKKEDCFKLYEINEEEYNHLVKTLRCK